MAETYRFSLYPSNMYNMHNKTYHFQEKVHMWSFVYKKSNGMTVDHNLEVAQKAVGLIRPRQLSQ